MGTMVYSSVGSNRLTEAKAFYDELMKLAGIPAMFEHPSGGRIWGRDGIPNFGVLGPYDKQPATVGNGAMVGFSFKSTAEVDAFYNKALAMGGKDEGAPGFRMPGMYFSYFRDLDGNKLCAFHMG